MVPPHCLNCHARGLDEKTHRCDVEDCPLLTEQTKKLNTYLIDLLLGERIINDWTEILISDRKVIKEMDSLRIS